MNSSHPVSPQSNTLGKASLVLGIFGIVFVFSVGICAGIGKEQGWLPLVSVLLFLVGATAAFMGFLSAVLGFFGLFGRNRSRITALLGMVLGAAAVLLFAAILNAVK